MKKLLYFLVALILFTIFSRGACVITGGSSASSSQTGGNQQVGSPSGPCTSLSIAPVGHCGGIQERSLHEFGIRTIQGFSPVILANTPLPTSRTRNFTTTSDNQKEVVVQVLTDRTIPLGTFKLSGIPPMGRGKPVIVVTFNVNAAGILTVSAMEDTTKKVQSLSIVSTSMNTVEPDRRVSDDSTYRELTSTLLGTWFGEKNWDITTCERAVAEFEASKRVEDFVWHMNMVMSMQVSECTKIDEHGDRVPDSDKLNTNFQSLINSIVKKLRPSTIEANLPDGLCHYHYQYIFNVLIPSIMDQMAEPGWVSADPGALTGTSWVERLASSHREKPHIEKLTAGYIWATSGYDTPAMDLSVAKNMGLVMDLLNKFAGVNKELYAQKCWGERAFEKDFREIEEIIRNFFRMEQRRGGSPNAIADEVKEVLDVLSTLWGEGCGEDGVCVDPMALSLARLKETLSEEFGI